MVRRIPVHINNKFAERKKKKKNKKKKTKESNEMIVLVYILKDRICDLLLGEFIIIIYLFDSCDLHLRIA